MKLVAASRILNESDIIEAFVRHTAQSVDHHILIDNGSVDGTIEILRSLRQEGLPITVLHSKSVSFVESQALTFMYQAAAVDQGADWVMFLDADEFIDDRELGQTLRSRLQSLAYQPDSPPAMQVRLRDYHATPEDSQDPIVPCRITQCTPVSNNVKIIIKGDLSDRGIVIQPGAHAAGIDGDMTCPSVLETKLYYAHYPTRSSYQWLSKSVIGWAKVIAAGPKTVRTGHAVHYRDPYEYLRTDPQGILRNNFLMQPQARTDLEHNPISYRGGPLKYTSTIDYAMRAVRVVMQYLNDLAVQHGEMLEMIEQLGDIVRRGEGEFKSMP